MSPHATREQLERMVHDSLDDLEREIISAHVQDCTPASRSWRT